MLERGVERVGENRRRGVPELVERAGAKAPDPPAVRLAERLHCEQPHRRHEQQERHREDAERHQVTEGRPAEPLSASASRAPQAEPERAERQHRQQDPPDGDVHDSQFGRDDSRCCEADGVAERRSREQLPGRPGEAQERQQPTAQEQHQDVREEQCAGVGGHGALIRDTHSGCSPARTCVMNLVWRSAGSSSRTRPRSRPSGPSSARPAGGRTVRAPARSSAGRNPR